MTSRSEIAGPGSSGDVEAVVLAAVTDLVADLHPSGRIPPVTLDSTLERGLGLDSLGLAELISRVEDTLGVSLGSAVLATVETPRDVVDAVRRAPRTRRGLARHARPSVAPVGRVAGVTGAAPDWASTLVEALEWHTTAHPDRVHLRVLDDDQGVDGELSYEELWSQGRRTAAGLFEFGVAPGDTLALMLPTCRDYFVVFIAVLLAGAVPVPLYPPARPSQLEDHLLRQAAILDNARAVLLVTVPEARTLGRLVAGRVDTLRHVVTPADLAVSGRLVPVMPARAQDVALVQYTSGSTGNPKGVVLTHANLLANLRAMGKAAAVTPSDVFVSWLPLYHDMGLIGAWLASLYFGLPLVVMSPLAFLAAPWRWLRTISAHQATLSAAPNFAFELCVRRVADADIEGIDLGSLRMLFNGAEPVSPETLERFAMRFAPFGLRREAIAPVYGLAEACVGVTFPPPGRGPVVDCVDRDVLVRRGRAVEAPESAGVVRFVACGRPLPGHDVRVVSGRGSPLAERQEGRIEFRGPSATRGYLHNPEATKALFDDGWVDTGDLGYLAGGDLYVTGRQKDLIIRAGRNMHPEEIEEAVGDVPGVRKGCVAVFAAPDPTMATERVVVVAETRETEPPALSALQDRVQMAVVDVLCSPADRIVLAPPGSVLKTSSGKIRRGATRQRYLQGTIGRRRRVWWQVTRFAVGGIGTRLRRAGRALSNTLFGVWCWTAFAAVALPTLLVVSLLPRQAWRRAAARRGVIALLRITGTPLAVHGRERLPRDRPVVIVANHASYLDSFALTAVLPASCTFVAGEIFGRKPVIGFVLRRLGVEFVERARHEQAVADAQRIARKSAGGETFVFFPEGGLSTTPGLRPFHLGAFVVAATTGRPVVPVAIAGTRWMLPPGAPVVRPGMIHITLLDPIGPAGSTWDDAVALQRTVRASILHHCGEADIA